MDLFDFVYYCFVNVQMISGIYQQYVVEFQFGFFQRCVNDIYWFLINIRREEINVYLFCQCFKLFDCCWVINVGRNYQYFFFVFFVQEFIEFINVGCFIGILQVCYQYDCRWLCSQVQGLVFFVYCCNQFVMDYFDEFLFWCQVFINFMINCFFFYVIDKFMYYWQSYVCFQQCYVYFVQCIFYVVFSEVFMVIDIVQCV